MFSREARPSPAALPGDPAPPLAGSPVERLRPRTATQILDAGFEVLRFRAPTIGILLATLHGPFFAASLWMVHHSGNGWFAPLVVRRLWEEPSLGDAPRAELAWLAGSFASSLFGEMLFAVGLAILMRRWMEGDDPSAATILRDTLRRLPGIVALWLIALLLKSLGAAICLVGLLLFVPHLSLLAPVMAFERGRGIRALARSRELVNRAPERVLFLTVVAPVFSILVPWALEAGADRGISTVESFSTVMGLVATLVLVVARSSATTLLYLDIRVRTEGLDLALRAPQALGTPS